MLDEFNIVECERDEAKGDEIYVVVRLTDEDHNPDSLLTYCATTVSVSGLSSHGSLQGSTSAEVLLAWLVVIVEVEAVFKPEQQGATEQQMAFC